MDSELLKYFKQVNSSQIEEYDDVRAPLEDMLKGERKKRFVRFSSEIFGELIKELTENPDCTYDTYINDLIKSGHVPHFISVMIKDPNKIFGHAFEMDQFREVIASRILNFFGCDTTYDTILMIDNKPCLCSVDFARCGEELHMLNTLPPNVFSNIVLDDNSFMLARKLDRFASDKHIEKNYEEMLEDVTDRYAYNFLVRHEVLADADYGFHNMGIIYSPNKKIFRLAPNFDMEYSFRFDDDRIRMTKSLFNNNFKCVKKYQNNMYEKFVGKFKEFISTSPEGKTKYQEIIEGVIGENEVSKKFVESYGAYLSRIERLIPEITHIKG